MSFLGFAKSPSVIILFIVCDREKVMRGLKRTDTLILASYQIYQNYMHQHKGLDGKTPAEICGIEIEGENKWITLIQDTMKDN
jgi:putative transposase